MVLAASGQGARHYLSAPSGALGKSPWHQFKRDCAGCPYQVERDYEPSTDERSSFKLEFPKSRDFWGKEAAPMLIHLSTKSGTVEWSHETVRDHTKERIRALLYQRVKQKAIAKELGLTEARISQIVKQMHEEDWANKENQTKDEDQTEGSPVTELKSLSVPRPDLRFKWGLEMHVSCISSLQKLNLRD